MAQGASLALEQPWKDFCKDARALGNHVRVEALGSTVMTCYYIRLQQAVMIIYIYTCIYIYTIITKRARNMIRFQGSGYTVIICFLHC